MPKRMPEVWVDNVHLDPQTADGRTRITELRTAAIRLRSFGAGIPTIADSLRTTEDVVEALIYAGLREIQAVDIEDIRAMQQAGLNDIKRAMYPHISGNRDVDEKAKAASVLNAVYKHEADLHGLKAPTRIRVGADQETFTTRVEEDLRELGIDPDQDVPLEEDDGTWANT